MIGTLCFNHRVTIRRESTTAGPSGAPVKTWDDIVASNEPAHVSASSGEITERAGKRDQRHSVRIYLGRKLAIGEDCRIEYTDAATNQTRYMAVAVFRDMGGQGRIFVAEGAWIDG